MTEVLSKNILKNKNSFHYVYRDQMLHNKAMNYINQPVSKNLQDINGEYNWEGFLNVHKWY